MFLCDSQSQESLTQARLTKVRLTMCPRSRRKSEADPRAGPEDGEPTSDRQMDPPLAVREAEPTFSSVRSGVDDVSPKVSKTGTHRRLSLK
jgi:hypothetical protein